MQLGCLVKISKQLVSPCLQSGFLWHQILVTGVLKQAQQHLDFIIQPDTAGAPPAAKHTHTHTHSGDGHSVRHSCPCVYTQPVAWLSAQTLRHTCCPPGTLELKIEPRGHTGMQILCHEYSHWKPHTVVSFYTPLFTQTSFSPAYIHTKHCTTLLEGILLIPQPKPQSTEQCLNLKLNLEQKLSDVFLNVWTGQVLWCLHNVFIF